MTVKKKRWSLSAPRHSFPVVKKSQSKSLQATAARDRIRAAIRRIPRGSVSTYGAIARASGLLHGARQVAQVLHRSVGLPWHRVLGAGGEIKLCGDSALEQKLRLQAEGVSFRGRRVHMALHEFKFRQAKK
jgi:methylated-DNA-protein-cysteine methyltransferase-like protein